MASVDVFKMKEILDKLKENLEARKIRISALKTDLEKISKSYVELKSWNNKELLDERIGNQLGVKKVYAHVTSFIDISRVCNTEMAKVDDYAKNIDDMLNMVAEIDNSIKVINKQRMILLDELGDKIPSGTNVSGEFTIKGGIVGTAPPALINLPYETITIGGTMLAGEAMDRKTVEDEKKRLQMTTPPTTSNAYQSRTTPPTTSNAYQSVTTPPTGTNQWQNKVVKTIPPTNPPSASNDWQNNPTTPPTKPGAMDGDPRFTGPPTNPPSASNDWQNNPTTPPTKPGAMDGDPRFTGPPTNPPSASNDWQRIPTNPPTGVNDWQNKPIRTTPRTGPKPTTPPPVPTSPSTLAPVPTTPEIPTVPTTPGTLAPPITEPGTLAPPITEPGTLAPPITEPATLAPPITEAPTYPVSDPGSEYVNIPNTGISKNDNKISPKLMGLIGASLVGLGTGIAMKSKKDKDGKEEKEDEKKETNE